MGIIAPLYKGHQSQTCYLEVPLYIHDILVIGHHLSHLKGTEELQQVVEAQVRQVKGATSGDGIFCCDKYGIPRAKEENSDNGVSYDVNDNSLDPITFESSFTIER